MASKLLHVPVTHTSNPSHTSRKRTPTLSQSFSFTTTLHPQRNPSHHQLLLTPHDKKQQQPRSRVPYSSPRCDLSTPPAKPPDSKKEAILQARTALASTLQRYLTNPRVDRKLKKPPMLRVEIPVLELSVFQLALRVFDGLPTRKKGSKIKYLFLLPTLLSACEAVEVVGSRSDILVRRIDVSVVDHEIEVASEADVIVFVAPEASQLGVMKTICEALYRRPAVIFNPTWGFDDESGFGELRGFVGSFEVVYSFAALDVVEMSGKRTGFVMKYVRDGVSSGEKWNVFFQVERRGELKLVSSFEKRPSLHEIENVLYNVMAMNSPITKSVRFLKNLFSNVIGKK